MSKQLQQQVDQNTTDIGDIKHSIDVIKNNHLSHIEKDMSSMDRRIEKMDMRLWAILLLLVAGTVISVIGV